MTRLPIKYFFIKPEEISAVILNQIHDLIQRGGGVGTSHIRANLQNAHLIGYAIHKDRVVGTSTHKHPKIEYRKKIEALTGLNLSGFLERGYTMVDPEYRGQAIGGKLIRGLIRKSKGEKIYVTIRMDNTPPLKMTWREGMVLAAKFLNKNTNQEIGVFTNQGDFPEL